MHCAAPSMKFGERNSTFRVTFDTISPVTRPYNPNFLNDADTPVHFHVPRVVSPRYQKAFPLPKKMNPFLPPSNTPSARKNQLDQES
jgi:hypothetical protein